MKKENLMIDHALIDGIGVANIQNSWAYVEPMNYPERYLITGMREVEDPDHGINEKRYNYLVCTPLALMTLSVALDKILVTTEYIEALEKQIQDYTPHPGGAEVDNG